MSLKFTLSGALFALSLAAPAMAEIEIHDPYARSSNPMAGAAFMVIQNTGDTDDRLIGVRSEVAARTELHTHEESDEGVMRMIHVEDGFNLPAGDEISMQRGSEHVMFMGLTAPFEQDDMISITLIFEGAGEMIVDVPVDQNREATGEMDADMGEDMDSGDMKMDDTQMDQGSDN